MANKWTIKKKASNDRIMIPNSSVELYCYISQSIDGNSINARLQGALIGGTNNAYTFDPDNEYTYPEKDAPIINTYKLQEDIMHELTPYIEVVGEKFNEILRRKGFIKK